MVLARVESGEAKSDLQPQSAQQLVTQSVSSMLETAKDSDIEIVVTQVPDALVTRGCVCHSSGVR